MASPGQLVKCVAEAFGIPAATVAMHDRALADAGIRKIGGRGPSAPKVTPLDAARLMIAVAATPIAGAAIANSADHCRQYSALPALGRDGKAIGWPKKKTTPECLAGLSGGHTVEDVLASLLKAAADGSIALGQHHGGKYGGFRIEFTFHAPTVRVTVSSTSSVQPFTAVDYGERPREKIAALTQRRTFDHESIEKVGRLLADREG